MTTWEEIVQQADLLGYRGKKREDCLKQEFKVLAERAAIAKKDKLERAARKEELERSARKEELEAERAARKEELEAERAAKKEEAERAAKIELEKMRLETERKMLQAKIQAGKVKEETVGNTSRFSDASAKHPKLPHFQDGKGRDLRGLLKVTAGQGSNSWSRDKWSSSLCALLTGRALDCYGRLSSEQAQDYEKVKQALMKREDLAEDGYRRKFRSCKPAEGESPDMFIVLIVTYLDRWIELSRTEKSHEKLKDLKDFIVREQFMDACPENLATSLREKDLPTLERIAKEADLFLQARHRKLCDQPRRVFQNNARPKVDPVRLIEPLEKVLLVDTPFKRVAMEMVGPINPPSKAGHRFILTLIDYATRYAEAVPLRKIDTKTVEEALVDIYSRLGVLDEMLSDQGTQFMSDCMKEVCRLLGIKQKATSPYHPMCNGLVQRFNATLKTCLRRLCSEQPRQWHRYINPLLFAYREVPQESTHLAPFELLYGRTVRGPTHILPELWTKDIEEPEGKSSYEYVLNLRERLDDTLKIETFSTRTVSQYAYVKIGKAD
ncbi:Pol polyprotein [Elysia marginata]|uniref:Pol polyprotein n=1 Tax=Elysia marginata TaxID=1093978 RepID=A0AAV4ERY8_9GAST|nr:Pol polyprotein [Elysia marginata]